MSSFQIVVVIFIIGFVISQLIYWPLALYCLLMERRPAPKKRNVISQFLYEHIDDWP